MSLDIQPIRPTWLRENSMAADGAKSGPAVATPPAPRAHHPYLVPEKRERRATAVVYAEARLNAWASWAREHRAALGYPSVSLLYKVLRRKAMRLPALVEHPRLDRFDKPIGLLTAKGTETLSFRPRDVGEVPEAIAEVDAAVASLPDDLHSVLMADYFTPGPIEVRAKGTRWKRARYSQLLECAKYAVYMALATRNAA